MTDELLRHSLNSNSCVHFVCVQYTHQFLIFPQALAPGTRLLSQAELEASGAQIISQPDGSQIITQANGSHVLTQADGSHILTQADGSQILTQADLESSGTRIITQAELEQMIAAQQQGISSTGHILSTQDGLVHGHLIEAKSEHIEIYKDVDGNSEHIDTNAEDLDPEADNLETDSLDNEPISENNVVKVEPETEPSGNFDSNAEHLDHIDPNSEHIDHNSEDIDHINPGSVDIDPGTEHMDPNTEESPIDIEPPALEEDAVHEFMNPVGVKS